MPPADDYYALLGVDSGAARDQIKKAFRQRARACHPDRVAHLDEDLKRVAEEKMVELNEAYAVLRDDTRRAAYDDRVQRDRAARRDPSASPAARQNRFGEQRFVARAAAEEFQQVLKTSVASNFDWSPLAYAGATLALQGQRGRSNLFFILLVSPQVDQRGVHTFLQSLESFAGNLPTRLFGRDRVFGFLAAAEFAEYDRQALQLVRFNRSRAGADVLRPATFIDLGDWRVLPDETTLETRIERLLRAA